VSDLDILNPAPAVVEIDGELLEITPLRVGELSAMLRAVSPFAEELVGEPDFLRLLAEHGDALITATAVASRRPKEWVEGLVVDDAIRLATALFEVNADFFVHRVVPAVQQAAARLKVTPAGAMPSTGSSVPDTATPTS
jgi:Family of unknown function (DUF6631)